MDTLVGRVPQAQSLGHNAYRGGKHGQSGKQGKARAVELESPVEDFARRKRPQIKVRGRLADTCALLSIQLLLLAMKVSVPRGMFDDSSTGRTPADTCPCCPVVDTPEPRITPKSSANHVES